MNIIIASLIPTTQHNKSRFRLALIDDISELSVFRSFRSLKSDAVPVF